MEKQNILLVEPDFPIPAKSKNHKNFLPIGLLKIASYLRENNTQVKLMRGFPKNTEEMVALRNFNPDEIWITSLFTYWAKYVKDVAQYYKNVFPQAKVVVGGIYASLLPRDEVKNYTGCDEVYQGVIPKVEKYFPAYDLRENANPHPIDYQIIHASRGCERECSFCGTWKIEPKFIPEKSIKSKIEYKKIVFYDNNLLMNPYIENILQELIELKKERKIIWCESQSGFDGRILLEKPYLAKMIKKAGFAYPRIAWDWKYKEYPEIKKQIDLLIDAGYRSKKIYVFILYNWEIRFEEMEMKRQKCWEWKVQITDCRFRPLNQLFDNFDARNPQTKEDYFIQSRWTDTEVKAFRRNVRQHNICVRHGFRFYSKILENKKVSKKKSMELRYMAKSKVKKILPDAWFPEEIHLPNRMHS